MGKVDGNTGTLGKAMAVVEAIASADAPLRFGDLARQVPQPKATLHRQISNLVEEGLVEARPDNTYGLGVRLLKLAARSWSDSQFRLIAEPHLIQLHKDTGETVHLGILQGIEVIYLDKVESKMSVRMHSQIGKASPCYCTGVGKAALSALPLERASELAAQIQYVRHTPHTITDAQGLLAELETIRRTGISYDSEEHETGIHCIAAPIYSSDRSLVAGLSVTAPTYRVHREQLDEWADIILATTSAIMDDMNIRMGPKS